MTVAERACNIAYACTTLNPAPSARSHALAGRRQKILRIVEAEQSGRAVFPLAVMMLTYLSISLISQRRPGTEYLGLPFILESISDRIDACDRILPFRS
jgi:hypothetical protein